MTNPGYMWMPRDWLSSTFVLSLKRHDRDIYRELLDRAWLDNGLPNDLAELARVLGEPRGRFGQLWAKLQTHFTLGADDRWRNPKQEHERKKQVELQARRSDAASRANAARWGSGADPNRTPNGSESDIESESDRSLNGIPNARVSPAPAPAPDSASLRSAGGSQAPPPAAEASPQPKRRKPRARPEKPTNPLHAPFVAWWCEDFEHRFGAKYGFDGGKDGDLVLEILVLAEQDLELAKARATVLLTSRDSFFAEKGIDLGTLRSQWNKLGSAAKTSPPGTHGNGHKPAQGRDLRRESEERYQAELRATPRNPNPPKLSDLLAERAGAQVG